MRRGNDRQAALPSKVCPVCKREFVWRKKWERDWDRVVYCSKACAAKGKHERGGGAKGSSG
ncbi:MAG: DUF2256 domain-containing protein [Planctomycetota bacterium]